MPFSISHQEARIGCLGQSRQFWVFCQSLVTSFQVSNPDDKSLSCGCTRFQRLVAKKCVPPLSHVSVAVRRCSRKVHHWRSTPLSNTAQFLFQLSMRQTKMKTIQIADGFVTYLVKLNHVRVANFLQNLDLAWNTVDVFPVLNASLFQYFDCYAFLSQNVFCHFNFSKSALAEWFACDIIRCQIWRKNKWWASSYQKHNGQVWCLQHAHLLGHHPLSLIIQK